MANGFARRAARPRMRPTCEGLAGRPARQTGNLPDSQRDETAPNPTTTAILRAGELADSTLYYRHDLYRLANPSLPTNCHGFAINLINPVMRPIALGAQDQTENSSPRTASWSSSLDLVRISSFRFLFHCRRISTTSNEAK